MDDLNSALEDKEDLTQKCHELDLQVCFAQRCHELDIQVGLTQVS